MPKVILHVIRTTGPTAQQSDMSHQARAKGHVYRFVNEQWALDNDAIWCDELITDNEEIKIKYEFD